MLGQKQVQFLHRLDGIILIHRIVAAKHGEGVCLGGSIESNPAIFEFIKYWGGGYRALEQRESRGVVKTDRRDSYLKVQRVGKLGGNEGTGRCKWIRDSGWCGRVIRIRSVPIYNNPHSFYLTLRISRYPSRTLGEQIRKWRLEHDFFQKELAKMIGVDEMTIVNWEKGKTKPLPAKLNKLNEIINFSK